MATPAMKISSRKLSAMTSRGGSWTKRGSAGWNGMDSCSSAGEFSRKVYLDWSELVSQVGSEAKSFARSVAPSLMMLKIAGAGDDPNGSRVRR